MFRRMLSPSPKRHPWDVGLNVSFPPAQCGHPCFPGMCLMSLPLATVNALANSKLGAQKTTAKKLGQNTSNYEEKAQEYPPSGPI